MPAIDPKYLSVLKEEIIDEITLILVNGRLAQQLLKLARFLTLKEELILAQKSFVSRDQSLEDLGIEKRFRLDYHLEGSVGNEAKIYSKPYKEAVRLLKEFEDVTMISAWQKAEKVQQIQKAIV